MTTPIAAPADAPIGPNIAPAFALSMAELTASMATFKPSAISPNAPPNESPSFEKVSERNCPDRMDFAKPFLYIVNCLSQLFRIVTSLKYAFQTFGDLLVCRAQPCPRLPLFSLSASEISFSLSGDLLHSSNVSFVIPKSFALALIPDTAFQRTPRLHAPSG